VEVVMGSACSGRYPRLSPQERHRIIGLVADGMRPGDVAREVARSKSMVYTVMREAGGMTRRVSWEPSPVRLSAGERELVVRALDAGTSFRAIAAQLGRAPSTVSRERSTPTAGGAAMPRGELTVGPVTWLAGRRSPNWLAAPVCVSRSRRGSARSCGPRRRSRPGCGSSSRTIR
jgi:transposase